VHALPICHLGLKAEIPKLTPYFLKTTRYPTSLRHIGDHIRRRRIDLGLVQTDVANQLGVDRCTYALWELRRTRPTQKIRPKVIEFLGYDPFHPKTCS
jgi:DNA-binding XRE family transcriptional regulator